MLYENPSISIASLGTLTFTFSSFTLNLDATDAIAIAYTLSPLSWTTGNGFNITASATLPNGSVWQVRDVADTDVNSGTIPIPLGIDWSTITVTVTNNTTASVITYISLGLVSDPNEINGNRGPVKNQIAMQVNSKVFATSVTDDFPLSLRSGGDASLIVTNAIPVDVATLSTFKKISSISSSSYLSWGDAAPTVNIPGRTITLPAVTTTRCILAPSINNGFPTALGEAVLDVSTDTSVNVKVGSIALTFTPSTVTGTLLIPQGYHVITVTSATSVAGTLTGTINGVAISGAVTATTTTYAQATNIANLVNATSATLTRATQIGSSVILRTLGGQTAVTPTITAISTISVVDTVSNTGYTTESFTLTNQLQTTRNFGTAGTTAYRVWFTPDQIVCYRRTNNDYPTWAFVGSKSLVSIPRGMDGDFLVFNIPSLLTNVLQKFNYATLYAKQQAMNTIASHVVTRSRTTYAVSTFLSFCKMLPTTSIFLKTISVENTATGPVQFNIVVDSAVPVVNNTIAFLGTNKFIVTNTLIANVITAGSIVASFLAPTGVTTFALNLPISPLALYTINMINDPAATAKTGVFGMDVVFDEVL